MQFDTRERLAHLASINEERRQALRIAARRRNDIANVLASTKADLAATLGERRDHSNRDFIDARVQEARALITELEGKLDLPRRRLKQPKETRPRPSASMRHAWNLPK
ncbi:hypothetical protein RYZ20_05050 [Thioclava sp. A2]|uniref:hypothetical protein n=1 Tax=Thioclava sp. FCG-A2 TaxID=3080562 RepID=UPI0029548913|nr:hypothetical protein [Thioclava sp. A2]MDV7270262.1 hypothetical protein [Thioclava sp. A2]